MSIPWEEEILPALVKLVKTLLSSLGTPPLDKRLKEVLLVKQIEESQLFAFLQMVNTLQLLISTMITTLRFGT